MNNVTVTDGQLGQLAVKQNELFARAKKGVYADLDEVLEAVQLVIEGKPPTIPTLATLEKSSTWRSFLIGGIAPKALLAQTQSGSAVSDSVKDMMKQKAFTTQVAEEEIETIILTPADFGYKRPPTTTELLDPVHLAGWNQKNACRIPLGYAVELLPAEAGPHIRNQYKDQPKGECLWVAMERITGSDGNPYVFRVGRDGDGEQWLIARWTNPDGQWGLGFRLVFRLRKFA